MTTAVLLLSLTAAGCAGKPWQGEPSEDLLQQGMSIRANLADRDQTCPDALLADVTLQLKTPTGEQRLAGYLELTRSSDFRFSVTNPFGQPLLLVTGSKKSFESLNTIERKYLGGRLRSLFLLHDLPLDLLEVAWSDVLRGQNLQEEQKLTAVYNDSNGEGLWLQQQRVTGLGVRYDYFQVVPEATHYRRRIITNESGSTVADISYQDWLATGTCLQPQRILVNELALGAKLTLDFAQPEFSEPSGNYRLPPLPSGYIRQLIP